MHRVLKRHIVVTLQLISVLRICSAVDLYSSFLPFSSTHNGRKATDLGFVQEKTWKKRGVLQFKSSHRLGDSVVMESNAEVCANTVQGPYLITDNRGRVCPVTDVDVNSGCCSESESKFLCLGCDLDSKCCDNYEYCVSCCQDPTITSLEYVQNISRLGDSKQRHLKSVFLFCQDRCRHNSKSVVHENAYIGELHHCYGRVEKKTGNSVAQEVNEMADLTIVMGMPGQSCEVACATAGTKGQGLKCEELKLRFLNNCQVLQKYFSCKSACVSSTGSDQPAEVVDSAPKHNLPGACLVNTNYDLFSCGGSFPYTRRLCPCSS